jgi:hypothetical protein
MFMVKRHLSHVQERWRFDVVAAADAAMLGQAHRACRKTIFAFHLV